jgi:deoxyribonuclease-4
MGAGSAVGVRNVIDACNDALEDSGGHTMILLENMAGQTNCVGGRFEELRLILDGVRQRKRIGVCFDSCHTYAAGFDLSSRAAVEQTMNLFDDLVGLANLKVVHLNDSKGPLRSRLDRHEHIGMGKIGVKGFQALLDFLDLNELPVIMETPIEERAMELRDMRIARRLMARSAFADGSVCLHPP